MTDYEYTREKLTSGPHAGAWDIDNPDRVDEEKQIHLAKEVETAIPGRKFRLVCADTLATFIFATTLTSEQETTLTTTVNNHKNNT